MVLIGGKVFSQCDTVSNVSVTSITGTTATVTATAPVVTTGITAYQLTLINLNTSASTNYAGGSTTWNLTGLTACTPYAVYVTTYCGVSGNTSQVGRYRFTTSGCATYGNTYTEYKVYGWKIPRIDVDSAFHLPIRDTATRGTTISDSGLVVIRPADSSFYYSYKNRWQKLVRTSELPTSGYGLTGNLSVDTTAISTRAWRQKGIDSLAGIINTATTLQSVSTNGNITDKNLYINNIRITGYGDSAAAFGGNFGIRIDRAASSATSFRGYQDRTNFTATAAGLGYASYDAQFTISGSQTYDHYVGVQVRPTYAGTGTLTDALNFYQQTTVTSGTVANNFGMFLATPSVSGTGSIGTNYGIYIMPQTNAPNRYGIYNLERTYLDDTLLINKTATPITTSAFSVLVLDTTLTNPMVKRQYITASLLGARAISDTGYARGVTADATIGTLSKVRDSLAAVKQGTLTLTTTGTSGAATLVGNTLNIPVYTGSGGGITGSGTATQLPIFRNSGEITSFSFLAADTTNGRLQIGGSTYSYAAPLQVTSSVTGPGGFNSAITARAGAPALIFEDTNADDFMMAADGGRLFFYGGASNTTAFAAFSTTGLYIGGTTSPTSLLHLAAGTTARAQIRFVDGVAPTSPNDGDMWREGTDLKIRLSGTTYTISKTP